jgi:hypothetical protein
MKKEITGRKQGCYWSKGSLAGMMPAGFWLVIWLFIGVFGLNADAVVGVFPHFERLVQVRNELPGSATFANRLDEGAGINLHKNTCKFRGRRGFQGVRPFVVQD